MKPVRPPNQLTHPESSATSIIRGSVGVQVAGVTHSCRSTRLVSRDFLHSTQADGRRWHERPQRGVLAWRSPRNDATIVIRLRQTNSSQSSFHGLKPAPPTYAPMSPEDSTCERLSRRLHVAYPCYLCPVFLSHFEPHYSASDCILETSSALSVSENFSCVARLPSRTRHTATDCRATAGGGRG